MNIGIWDVMIVSMVIDLIFKMKSVSVMIRFEIISPALFDKFQMLPFNLHTVLHNC